jgi:hypothetical protein
MDTKGTLLSRINGIERELRIWRVAGTIAILSTVLLITAAASSKLEVPDVIQAREFQLVGEDGEVRAELKTLGNNNTQLRLYDGSGKSEVSIAANEQRAIVNLKHDNKTNRAVIEAHNLGAEVALLKDTEEGRVLTHVVGGVEGSFVKLKPLTGSETSIPAKR